MDVDLDRFQVQLTLKTFPHVTSANIFEATERALGGIRSGWGSAFDIWEVVEVDDVKPAHRVYRLKTGKHPGTMIAVQVWASSEKEVGRIVTATFKENAGWRLAFLSSAISACRALEAQYVSSGFGSYPD
jgi:hypothetical protein